MLVLATELENTTRAFFRGFASFESQFFEGIITSNHKEYHQEITTKQQDIPTQRMYKLVFVLLALLYAVHRVDCAGEIEPVADQEQEQYIQLQPPQAVEQVAEVTVDGAGNAPENPTGNAPGNAPENPTGNAPGNANDPESAAPAVGATACAVTLVLSAVVMMA